MTRGERGDRMRGDSGRVVRSAFTVSVAFAVWAASAEAQRSRDITLTFVAATAADEAARAEYESIWREDGAAIVRTMEDVSRMVFEEDSIGVVVVEEASSSGFGALPMRMRSSYPLDTKRATLIHELGHRLQNGYFLRDDEDHPALFLYLYDVWVDLYGAQFAEEQVAVESRRRGLYDYEGAWRDALALTREERSRMLREELAARRR
jgi:hypothetical protein